MAFGEALRPSFKTYTQQIVKNASVLARCLMDGGYDLVSGGTDNHLMLMDLRAKDFTGKDAEHALDQAGITVNKNTVPLKPGLLSSRAASVSEPPPSPRAA